MAQWISTMFALQAQGPVLILSFCKSRCGAGERAQELKCASERIRVQVPGACLKLVGVAVCRNYSALKAEKGEAWGKLCL